MDVEQAEHFVHLAQEDYRRRLHEYERALEHEEEHAMTHSSRTSTSEARADVMAAAQMVDLACAEAAEARLRRDKEEEERE